MLQTNAFLSRHSPLSVKLLLLCRRLGSFLRSAHKSKRRSSNLERALTAADAAGCLLHVAGAAAEGWAPPSFQLKHLTVGVWKAGRSKKTPSSEEENQGGSPPLLGTAQSLSESVCSDLIGQTDTHACSCTSNVHKCATTHPEAHVLWGIAEMISDKIKTQTIRCIIVDSKCLTVTPIL